MAFQIECLILRPNGGLERVAADGWGRQGWGIALGKGWGMGLARGSRGPSCHSPNVCKSLSYLDGKVQHPWNLDNVSPDALLIQDYSSL